MKTPPLVAPDSVQNISYTIARIRSTQFQLGQQKRNVLSTQKFSEVNAPT